MAAFLGFANCPRPVVCIGRQQRLTGDMLSARNGPALCDPKHDNYGEDIALRKKTIAGYGVRTLTTDFPSTSEVCKGLGPLLQDRMRHPQLRQNGNASCPFDHIKTFHKVQCDACTLVSISMCGFEEPLLLTMASNLVAKNHCFHMI